MNLQDKKPKKYPLKRITPNIDILDGLELELDDKYKVGRGHEQ